MSEECVLGGSLDGVGARLGGHAPRDAEIFSWSGDRGIRVGWRRAAPIDVVALGPD